MFSWFMCCEIFKALIILTYRFFCAHVSAFVVIFITLTFLFNYSVAFRRTVWFFYQHLVFFSAVAIWCTLVSPVILFRGRKFENVLLVALIGKLLARVMGIEYEIRNKKNVITKKGVVVSNHPSALDALSRRLRYMTYKRKQQTILGLNGFFLIGMMYIVNDMKSIGTTIASYNLYLLGLFGWVLHQCGFGFIRKTPGLQSTYEEINRIADEACDKEVKIWVYPEGRTSEKPTEFKKGAFRIAVDRKIPILPVVFSPHSFIDWDNLQSEKGKVIVDILPPIPTTEYTHENMNSLIKRTHTIICQKYEELKAEIEREKCTKLE